VIVCFANNGLIFTTPLAPFHSTTFTPYVAKHLQFYVDEFTITIMPINANAKGSGRVQQKEKYAGYFLQGKNF